MDGYAQLFASKRFLVVAFVGVMSLLAIVGLGRLEFDDVPRGIFVSEDEAHDRLEQLYAEFGSDDNEILLVLEADDWFAGNRVRYLRRLSSELRELERIEAVAGLSDLFVFEGGSLRPLLPEDPDDAEDPIETGRRVEEHPLASGRLLSADGRTTLIVARLDEGAIAITDIQPAVRAIRQVVERQPDDSGVSVRLTGVPPIRVEIYTTISREQWIFFFIGSALCLLLSTLLFRSFQAVLVTSIPPLFGSFWAVGFMGLLGQRVDILSAALPMLVIVIGFTDSVHLMIDVRISRGAGQGPLGSAVEAIRHLGLPCALTSLTTGVGFGSLAVGNVGMVGRFGVLAALSVVLVFLAVITVLPLLASFFPNVGTSSSRVAGPWSGRFARLIDLVTAHPRATVACGVLTTAALLLSAWTLVPENRLAEALPRGEAYQGLIRCEAAFGGILPAYVLVEWNDSIDVGSPELASAIAEAEALLDQTPEVSAPLSFLSLLDLVPGGRSNPAAFLPLLPAEVAARFVRLDLSKAVIRAQVPDGDSGVMTPLYTHLVSRLEEIDARYPNLELHLTGTDFVARSNVNGMIDDLTRSLAFAILIIFGVIALEFRSIFLGLVSLIPNLFPLAVVAGLLVLFDMPLQMSSAVLFTVLLGLAVDDTIHFLARVRRESAGPGASSDPRQVLRNSFLAVGKAILITTIVLGAGFSSLVFSSVPTTQTFGIFAVAGLFAALIGDLILLPALLMLRRRRRS